MTWSSLPWFSFEGCSSLLPFLFASCRKSWLVLAVSTGRQRYLSSAPGEKHLQAKVDELRLDGERSSICWSKLVTLACHTLLIFEPCSRLADHSYSLSHAPFWSSKLLIKI